MIPCPTVLELNVESHLQNLKNHDGYLSVPAIIGVSNMGNVLPAGARGWDSDI